MNLKDIEYKEGVAKMKIPFFVEDALIEIRKMKEKCKNVIQNNMHIVWKHTNILIE